MRHFLQVTGMLAAISLSFSPAAAAVGVESHVIAKEHVNLVRVPGDRITDVVFDSEALEVQADKTRGVVFVRVKPLWASQGNTQTAAFVNTAAGSAGVTFKVESIPSQIVELTPVRTAPDTFRPEGADDDVPLVRFSDSDYLTELKTLVRRAQQGSFDITVDAGAVFRENEGRVATPVTFKSRKSGYGGLSVRETAAWTTADKIVEKLVVTNLAAKAVRLDPALWARAATGTLAVAGDKTELLAGEMADVILIRSRAAALEAARAEGRSGVVLACDAIARLETSRSK